MIFTNQDILENILFHCIRKNNITDISDKNINCSCIKRVSSKYLLISKNIYDVFVRTYKFNCKISKKLFCYDLTICKTHNNYIDFYKKIIGAIDLLKKQLQHNRENNLCNNMQITNLGFIHLDDLKKNETQLKILLEHFGLELVRYCCNGNGILINTVNMQKLNKYV